MPWMRLCFPASRRRPLRFPSWRTRTALGPRRQVRTFQFAISPTRPKLPRVPSAQQTCIVTGTGGYLGGRVKAALQQRGWRVVVLTRQPGPDTSAIRFQLGEEVSAADLKGAGALVHCAYDSKQVSWAGIHAINVAGSEKLLRAAREAKIGQLVYVSSISAFEGCRSLYGKAKLETEKIALALG